MSRLYLAQCDTSPGTTVTTGLGRNILEGHSGFEFEFEGTSTSSQWPGRKAQMSPSWRAFLLFLF